MKRTIPVILLAALWSTALLAHGSMEHILGTVVSVSADAIVVKTTAGEAKTVKLEATTKVLVGDAPGSMKDVHPGDRVVVHAMKHEGGLVAAEIKVNAAASGVQSKRKGEQ